MLKNLLRIPLRNLFHNGIYTLTNVLGMSVAVAAAIVAYINYDYAASYDDFHSNVGSIYRVIGIRAIDQKETRYGIVPLPLGPALERDLPGVGRAVRIEPAGSIVRCGNNTFDETILYADPGFFEMFTFPLAKGTADLSRRNQIVISEEYAEKLFAGQDPIGRVLTSTYSNGQVRDLVVSGVLKESPRNSSIRFDMVAASDVLVDVGLNTANDWSVWTGALFLQVTDPAALPKIADHLKRYVAVQNAANVQVQLAGYRVESIKQSHAHNEATRNNVLSRGTPASHVYGMMFLGLQMLLLACFNFVNSGIVLAGRRQKEIGVRKVLGSRRWQLVAQFLSESVLLCLVSLALGLVLAWVILPYFNDLYVFVHLTMQISGNWDFLLFLAALLIATGIGAALYPALVMSAPQPVRVLRGEYRTRRVTAVMRVLLTAQFALSIMTVIGSLSFARNADYVRDLDVGFQREGMITVPVSDGTAFARLKDEIAGNPAVESVSGSEHYFYARGALRSLRYAGVEQAALVYNVGFNFIETMRLRLVEGRAFDERLATDQDDAVVVSRMLVRELGWDSAVGKAVSLEDHRYQVVGVIEDILPSGPWRPMEPVLLRLAAPDSLGLMQVRVRPEATERVFEEIRNAWPRLFPDRTFNGFFDHPSLTEALQISENVKKNMDALGAAMVLLSCIGLLALVSLNVTARKREVGIRRVLGATTTQLVRLINRIFVVPAVCALLLADVGGYLLVKLLLGAIYTYNSGVDARALIAANIIVGVVALVTITTRVYRAASANPVQTLRHE